VTAPTIRNRLHRRHPPAVVVSEMTMARKSEATRCNEQGNTCRESGNLDAAIELYERAAELDPKWSSPHYNLGLVYKYQNRWKESLACNRAAAMLNPKDEAAWWNLGIAATALGDWKTARDAWRGFGIDIPPGNGPLEFPCGVAPIRLNPDGPNVEVVWADRLCPARARLTSIPLPESGHRWGDVVLNDGAPVGYRKYGNQELGVFNELELLESSGVGTFVVEWNGADDSSMDALETLAFERGMAAEDWTTSLHRLCKACSEGRPHDRHDHDGGEPAGATHRIAIAAKTKTDAKRLLKDWAGSSAPLEIQELLRPHG
jgi:tetratricopeptide (TPR) repeat protein